MMQILAPAGNADSLAAAVRSGADAFIWGRGFQCPPQCRELWPRRA